MKTDWPSEHGLVLSLQEEVGTITLSRPEVKNAISRRMWDSLLPAMEELQEHGARLIVFAGAQKVFSAGADIAELKSLVTDQEKCAHFNAIRDALNAVASFDLPTIAKVTGPCLGGGCLLALACDLRYCDARASFSIPVAKYGIALDPDNVERLVQTVGRAKATEMLFTAGTIYGQHAEPIGLVHCCFDQDLDEAVAGVAATLKSNSPASIKQLKSTIARVCRRGRVEFELDEGQELRFV